MFTYIYKYGEKTVFSNVRAAPMGLFAPNMCICICIYTYILRKSCSFEIRCLNSSYIISCLS